MRVYDVIRFHIVPPSFLVIFTILSQVLAWLGSSPGLHLQILKEHNNSWINVFIYTAKGNLFSWLCLAAMIIWATLWLHVPSEIYYGPITSYGYRPKYKANGILYFFASVGVFLLIRVWKPGFYLNLYNNMPFIMGTLQFFAIIFCVLLWIKGRIKPDFQADVTPNLPYFYEFYRGIETHPRLLGMDVKQWTNCRMGMMMWQLLIISFFFASLDRYGFNMAMVVNLFLQSIYICKFFFWETGYFRTLDIILDRASFYICWGCLVWVPALYTFSSYYLVANRPEISFNAAIAIGIFGIFSIIMNYLVDLERQMFRQAGDKGINLWGRPARFISASYRNDAGQVFTTRLLISGSWGLARHLNYLFELLAALSWCMCSYGLGSILPFSYFIFLLILLVHRIFRDEEKCHKKYGRDWEKYCEVVPYRMVPYIF